MIASAHMADKTLPFAPGQLEELADRFPTPFHIYHEAGIRQTVRRLLRAFSWNPGFKEFFAVKATPNPYLLKILKQEGCGMDCSSLPELRLSETVGIVGPEIMFSSNDTPAHEFVEARKLGATINLDDISHIDFLEKHAGIPETVCVRFNPGETRSGSLVMGNPQDAKYGFTREQVLRGLRMLKDKGARTFGLHTFIASNELDHRYFVATARMLYELAVEIKEELDIRISFINTSGGIGIPYQPGQTAVDLEAVSGGMREEYERLVVAKGLDPMALYMELGRSVTGPHGFLVSRVLHIKEIYKKHVGLDACMANLMRPAMYGAYHHITVLGKERQGAAQTYDVTGSLCESNDRFAVDRALPEVAVGDLMVIHDTGAHGHAMGFNYNGKLRSAELLLRETGEVLQIRRAETLDDYFATLDFQQLGGFS